MRALLLAIPLLAACGAGPTPGRGEDSAADPGDSAEPEGPLSSDAPCGQAWYADADEDGWGDAARRTLGCIQPSGWVSQAGDCDDADPARHPGAEERCNGLDDDCNGRVDDGFEAPQAPWYPDADGDGWGWEPGRFMLCGGGEGLVARGGDCNDRHPGVHPGARSRCDGVDHDCDGEIDEGCGGSCGDGVKGGAHEACDGSDDHACPGACSAHCACPSGEPGALRVRMIDVGQGDALLITSPAGFTTLVDAGPSDACDEVELALEREGVPALDYTVVSHQHSDHLGAMDTLLRDHPEVVAAFDNDGYFDSSSDLDYFHSAGRRRRPLRAGDTIDLGDDAALEVLHAHTGSGNENDNSVVLLLRHGSFAMLLGGDCEWACEQTLEPGVVDVYKVHHHGSANGSSEPLLDRMLPLVALIPVGWGNSYGHPHASTLQRFADRGVQVLRTDLDGDITLETDGEVLTVAGVEYRLPFRAPEE